MNWLMGFKFICCAETLWTFIANIRLYAFFVSLHVSLEVTFAAEFLLTNVTLEPSAFVLQLQQMCLQLSKSSKAFRTVSTRLWLCTSVNTNMTIHIWDCHKLLSRIRTWMRSYVAVYTSFMPLQVAGLAETFVTQWTLVQFLSSVDSAVPGKIWSHCKSFSAHRTLKRFLSRMNSSVCCQFRFLWKTLSTFNALVSVAMNIHMLIQVLFIRKPFLAFSTWIHLVTVCFTVSFQCTFSCKVFVTICAHTWSWVAVTCWFSGICFVFYFVRNFTCKKVH